jgi:hypothetical protein
MCLYFACNLYFIIVYNTTGVSHLKSSASYFKVTFFEVIHYTRAAIQQLTL